MSGTASADEITEALTLDPYKSTFVLLLGPKGKGKSVAARTLFDAWPFDRSVIDPTGDARPADPLTRPFIAPFPSQLPEPDAENNEHRITAWLRINPASPTLAFDQDMAVGMALAPRRRRKLIWRDEYAVGASPNKMLANDQTLMLAGRHWNTSALFCCPRPVNIPVLARAQADKIGIFTMRADTDRELIAKDFGVSVPLFERMYNRAQRLGKYSFLWLDRELDLMLACPALPLPAAA